MTATLRPATRHTTRRVLTFTLAAVMALSLVGVWRAGDAEASSYRFWSYWIGGSDWSFATQGASRHPVDGGVEGWRFSISPDSSSAVAPRHAPTFNRICGDTDPQTDKKRVGLVIDYGVSSDAPSGESPPSMIVTCAVVPEDANGYEVLTTVAQLRTDAGMICGINGYPATECGTAVSDPTPSPSGSSDGGDKGPGSTGGGGDSSSPNGGSSSSGGTPTSQNSDKTGGKGKKDGAESGKDKKRSASPDPTESGDTDSAVAAVSTASAPTSPSNGSPIGVIIGVVLIAVLGTAAFVFHRRRT